MDPGLRFVGDKVVGNGASGVLFLEDVSLTEAFEAGDLDSLLADLC